MGTRRGSIRYGTCKQKRLLYTSFILPLPPNRPSPSSTLISHISRSLPAEPLPPFSLDHRLFVDTSSLLPTADISQRRSTSILTLSHSPKTNPKLNLQSSLSRYHYHSQPFPLPPPKHSPSSSGLNCNLSGLIGNLLSSRTARRSHCTMENGQSA